MGAALQLQPPAMMQFKMVTRRRLIVVVPARLVPAVPMESRMVMSHKLIVVDPAQRVVAIPGSSLRAKAATGSNSVTPSGSRTRRPVPSCVTVRLPWQSNGRSVAGSKRVSGAGWP